MFSWLVCELIAPKLQPPQCNELPEGLRQHGQFVPEPQSSRYDEQTRDPGNVVSWLFWSPHSL